MRLVDVNVLLYAVNRQSAHHDEARDWLDRALNGSEAVAFAWAVVLAFVRLGTHPAVFPNPLPHEEAIGVASEWLAQPPAVIVEPTSRHLELLAGLLAPIGTGGNLVSDAHLAVLAIEHGAELVSYDPDFGRFPGLRWRTPASP